MPSTARSRRRATAVAVPSAVAVLLAGALAAAPALAASSAPNPPFPSLCPNGQSASADTAAPAAGSTPAGPTTSTTPSASASAAASATQTPAASTTPAKPVPSASPTPKPTVNAPNASASASASADPSTGPTAAGTGNGFWGWVNGVWTWIFADSPQTAAAHPAVVDAVAPLSDAHAVHAFDAAAASGTQPSAGATAGCVGAAEASSLAAAAAAGPSEGFTVSTIPWVMKTPTMTMWNLTYNGVKSVRAWDPSTHAYVDENVLDFTGTELDIKSMVTYSIQNGQTVYNNAGSGSTTTLTNPHLMVLKLTADLYGLLQQTYTPQNPPPLLAGVPIPILPVVFTNVTSVNAALHTDGISVPGFNGFASAGVASPQ